MWIVWLSVLATVWLLDKGVGEAVFPPNSLKHNKSQISQILNVNKMKK